MRYVDQPAGLLKLRGSAMCQRLQAVASMFHLVYGLFPATGPAAEFEANTFASKAKAYDIPLPQVTAIINNK